MVIDQWPAAGEPVQREDRPSWCRGTLVAPSLDNLVRLREQRRRARQPQRLRGLQVDDELELRRQLDRQVAGLGALEDLVDVGGGVGRHDERSGARGGQGGERALQLIRPPELDKLEAHAEDTGRAPDVSYLASDSGIG